VWWQDSRFTPGGRIEVEVALVDDFGLSLDENLNVWLFDRKMIHDEQSSFESVRTGNGLESQNYRRVVGLMVPTVIGRTSGFNKSTKTVSAGSSKRACADVHRTEGENRRTKLQNGLW
jgi:hypothetical protein